MLSTGQIGRVARRWLPERWAAAAELSKTDVGKLDTKAIRALAAERSISVLDVTLPAR
jgi:acyl-coenzyme A synthetase/AMP-(fatty) acid ligase